MTFLITGANGFLGSHFCSFLSKRGVNYFKLTSENEGVLKKENFEQFSECKIQVVIHFAGKTFVPESWEKPDKYLNQNLQGIVNVLEFCRESGSKVIFISSYMYGKPDYLPIDEGHPVRVLNPYGLSKRLSEEICEFYSTNYHVSTIIVRPFNIYGPDQKEDFLIPLILNQLISKKEVSVMDLAPKRDYLFVDDFIQALWALSISEIQYGIFNVGSGISYSVEEIIEQAQELLGTNHPVFQKGERRANEVMDVVADNTSLRSEVGWQPEFSLKSGLEQCITALKKAN